MEHILDIFPLHKAFDSCGRGVKVAILDTGIDLKNACLQTRISGIRDFCNPVAGTGQDLDGHGTELAGVISLLAKDAGVLIGKIMPRNGFFTYDALEDGLRWAIRESADIICIASGERYPNHYVHEVLKNAVGDSKIVVLSAIGNEGGRSVDSGYFPARFEECLAVGSINEKGDVAVFSDDNPTLQILCAPGEKITTFSLTGELEERAGTSISTAYVSAVMAVVISRMKEMHIEVNPKDLKSRIFETAILKNQNSGKLYILDSLALMQSCLR